MNNDISYLQQFKTFCKNVDGKLEDTTVMCLQYYRIHKRSMPVGIDKPVLFNLTYEEAKAVIFNLRVNQKESGVFVYYDIVKEI